MHQSSYEQNSRPQTSPELDAISEDFELDLTLADGTQFDMSGAESITDLISEHHANRQPLFEYEEALENYEAVCKQIKATGDYESSRGRYRFCSFELNAHGRVAPAFRKELQTGKKLNDPIFFQIHRDQITIDCHWLYCRKEEVTVNSKDDEFADLVTLDAPFDFSLCDRFAAMKWKRDNRVLECMRLTDFLQVQLSALQSSEMKMRIQRLDEAIKGDNQRLPSPRSTFERKLSTWEKKSASAKKHRLTYQALWKLHSALGPSMNGRVLSELLSVATGQPQKDPKTVKTQLETLLKNMGG